MKKKVPAVRYSVITSKASVTKRIKLTITTIDDGVDEELWQNKLYTSSVTWFLNGIKPVYSPTIFCILLCTLFKELVKMLLVDRQFQNCIKLDWLSNMCLVVCMCQSYKYFHQYIYIFVVATFHLILFDLNKREKNRSELLNNTVELNELQNCGTVNTNNDWSATTIVEILVREVYRLSCQ